MPQFTSLRERIRLSLWFLPGLFALGATALALALVEVDKALTQDPGAAFFMFGGTPEGARSVLSTIAQSMLTFTGLVFSITMLVLQLASSQLSPRVMRTFLRDRSNQVVLGLFIATFIYTLLVLREVRAPVDGSDGFVPELSIWVAFVLLLASVAAFIYYIDHMAHAIRASTVISNIAKETAGAIERLYPERVGQAPEPRSLGAPAWVGRGEVVVKAGRAGYVVAVDDEQLLEVATDGGDRQIELVPMVGQFVAEGAPLVRLAGTWDRDAADRVRDSIGIGDERTLEQDAAFGLRQLVDVALRALSPGINDPSTAVQALDRIYDLLRQIATREIPSPVRTDDSGQPRLLLPRPGWDEYVRLGFDEIRLAGESQLQIGRRMLEVLVDLRSVVGDERQQVLIDQVQRFEAGVRRGFADPTDRAGVLAADEAQAARS